MPHRPPKRPLTAEQQIIVGLLEIANHVMPDTFWDSDSRIEAARKHLGDLMPSREQLHRAFARRTRASR